MKGIFPIDKFRTLQTPFYYYDTKVLRDTLSAINQEVAKYPSYSVHYAVKANANPKVLTIIRESGMGADCVSGGEIRAAVRAGFPANKIVFAGVGKADWEINLGLEYGIFCFNVESIPELEVINELAAAQNKIANVAFRINPDVGAHTHANITTGLAENKFGISMQDMDRVIDVALEMKNVKFIGLHFHIGSQILDMGDFIALCNRVNELQDKLVENVNYFRDQMTAAGFDIKPTQSAICAVMLYDAKLSQIYAARMQEEGIYVTGFYYPVVPKEQARIRVQISAGHEKAHLDKCIAAFIKVGKELGTLK